MRTTDCDEVSYGRAINAALAEELERDPSVFVMGQDVGVLGGVYGVTRGLLDRFGSERVIDTAIVEHFLVGGAVGAALSGMRPVVEIQYADFLLLAGDETINKLGKWRYIHGGVQQIPVTIRAPMGAQGGVGAEHSQCVESYLWHNPGLLVVVPSTPSDAKGLLKSAIRDDNPTLFLEHRGLYRVRGPVSKGDDSIVPLGVAATRRRGRDVSVFTWSAMVHVCLEAAELAAADGVDVEVVDLRCLRPLDREAIAQSLARTGRAMVVHEASKTMGAGAEIAAILAEELFTSLKAPVRRIAGYDVPLPQSAHLEAMWLPNAVEIATAAKELAAW